MNQNETAAEAAIRSAGEALKVSHFPFDVELAIGDVPAIICKDPNDGEELFALVITMLRTNLP